MARFEPAPGMPALLMVSVLAALVVPTSWSAKAPEPVLANAGTAPAKSLPISAKVVDWAPPAGRPGPSTRKKLVPRGLPMTGTSVIASPMNPAGGARAPGAAGRNGPYRPPIASAKSHGPTAVTAQPMSVVVRPRAPAAGTLTVSVPYGWVIV